MTTIIGIVLCAIFLTIQASEDVQPVNVIRLNGCSLKYMNNHHVSDKPDNIFTLQLWGFPGVCRIQKNQNESTDNYEELEVKYYRHGSRSDSGCSKIGPDMQDTFQEYDKGDICTLSFDARTKSIMYLNKHDGKRQLIRRRLNDTQFVDKFLLKKPYKVWSISDDFWDFAYDWVTKNLYIYDGVHIAVVNLEKPSLVQVDLIRSLDTYSTNFVVHPNAGYLFYTEVFRVNENGEYFRGGDYKSIIYRTFLDGSNKTQIGPNNMITKVPEFISNLAIDYHTDRLYWCEPGIKVLKSSNLDGTDIKTVKHGCYPDYSNLWPRRSTAFDKKYIYYSTETQIHRLNKETLKGDRNFGIATRDAQIHQILVFDPEAQKITSDNPCSVDNGGCEHYCFALPNANSTKVLQRKCVSTTLW